MAEEARPNFDTVVAGLGPEMEAMAAQTDALRLMDELHLGRRFVSDDTGGNLQGLQGEEVPVRVPIAVAVPRNEARDSHVLFGEDRIVILESPRDPAGAREYDDVFNHNAPVVVSSATDPITPLLHGAVRPPELYSFLGAHHWVTQDSNGQTDLQPFQNAATGALSIAFQLGGIPRDDLTRITVRDRVMGAYFPQTPSREPAGAK